MKQKLLYINKLKFQKNTLTKLKKKFEIIKVDSIKDLHNNLFNKIEILIVPMDNYYDKNVLEKFNNLKFILSPTTGNIHIDLNYISFKKITFLNLKKNSKVMKSVTATAEHTFALLFELIRNYNLNYEYFLNKKINFNSKFISKYSLFDLSIGIVGLGRIGKKVAIISKRLGLKVYYFDPKVDDRRFTRVNSIRKLAENSNIITLHLHLNQKNKKIINLKILQNIKKPSFFINTSRGELVDEKNLYNLIKNYKLDGCGLDTLENEYSESFQKNPKKNILLNLYIKKKYNLIITPKIGGAVKEAWEITENYLINELIKKYE